MKMTQPEEELERLNADYFGTLDKLASIDARWLEAHAAGDRDRAGELYEQLLALRDRAGELRSRIRVIEAPAFAAPVEHYGASDPGSAEQQSYDAAVVARLNNEVIELAPEGRCQHCMAQLDEHAIAVLAPGRRPIHLHRDCHGPWMTWRRDWAEATLASYGVERPAGG